jgi:hypothetical protein
VVQIKAALNQSSSPSFDCLKLSMQIDTYMFTGQYSKDIDSSRVAIDGRSSPECELMHMGTYEDCP